MNGQTPVVPSKRERRGAWLVAVVPARHGRVGADAKGERSNGGKR